MLEPDGDLRPQQTEEQVAILVVSPGAVSDELGGRQTRSASAAELSVIKRRAADQTRAKGLSRSTAGGFARSVAGFEQGRQGGELPGCVATPLPRRLAEIVRLISSNGARSFSETANLHQRSDDRGRRRRLALTTAVVAEHWQAARSRRAGRPSSTRPRASTDRSHRVSPGVRELRPRGVVPVSERQRDLEADAGIGVVGQPKDGIGHRDVSSRATGPAAATTLSRTLGIGIIETRQRRWLVEPIQIRPASRSPGRASWAAVVVEPRVLGAARSRPDRGGA